MKCFFLYRPGTDFALFCLTILQFFTILQDKLHSYNIQDDGSTRFLCTTDKISPIYTTFILGPARLKMGTRAVTYRLARLIFCRVSANCLARGTKKSGGPGPPREVVLARLKSGSRADAILLVIASQSSLIQVHTNEVDTPNKFVVGLYSDV